MRILDKEEVTRDKIKEWVEIVNKEFGLSDNNDYSISWIESVKDYCIFVEDKDFCIVCLTNKDIWGNMVLGVISLYIKPKARSLQTLNIINKIINDLAISRNCKYICQGAHLDNRYIKYLERKGYSMSEMRKQIIWE